MSHVRRVRYCENSGNYHCPLLISISRQNKEIFVYPGPESNILPNNWQIKLRKKLSDIDVRHELEVSEILIDRNTVIVKIAHGKHISNKAINLVRIISTSVALSDMTTEPISIPIISKTGLIGAEIYINDTNPLIWLCVVLDLNNLNIEDLEIDKDRLCERFGVISITKKNSAGATSLTCATKLALDKIKEYKS